MFDRVAAIGVVDDCAESKKRKPLTVCAVDSAQCLLGYVRWSISSNNLNKKPSLYYQCLIVTSIQRYRCCMWRLNIMNSVKNRTRHI